MHVNTALTQPIPFMYMHSLLLTHVHICVHLYACTHKHTAVGGKTYTHSKFIEYACEQLLQTKVVQSVTMKHAAYDSQLKPVSANDTEVVLRDIESAKQAWQAISEAQHTEKTNNNDQSSRAPVLLVFEITVKSNER
jgi:hypothetical protein